MLTIKNKVPISSHILKNFCKALMFTDITLSLQSMKKFEKRELLPSLFFLGSFPCNVTRSSENAIKCTLHSTRNVFRVTNDGSDLGTDHHLHIVNAETSLTCNWFNWYLVNASNYLENNYYCSFHNASVICT